jgi:hypothetical protein
MAKDFNNNTISISLILGIEYTRMKISGQSLG